MTKVAGYIRISSKTNENGDSKERQILAIKNYAKANDMRIVRCDADIGVRGSTNIFDRKGLREVFEYCLEENIKIILCESASRFARDQMVGEWGYRELKKHGIQIVPVDSPDYYTLENDDPMINLIRQVLGSIAEFEKNSLVAKLRGARERVKAKNGKCEGRKSLKEIMGDVTFTSMVRQVKSLRKQNKSYASIAGMLASKGYVQPSTGKPFHKSQIMGLIK
jgi:DNA invertase Pin-like site-specific DNA recombinase